MRNVLAKNFNKSRSDYIAGLQEKISELEKQLAEKDEIISDFTTNKIWYETIVENSGAGLTIYDENTKIIMVNSHYMDGYGYRKEDLIGHSWTEVVHEDDVKFMLEYHAARSIDPNSAPRNYIYRHYTKDRSIRYVHLTTVLIPNTKLRVASGIDVTDLVNFEKALGESEKKYRLLVETMNDGLVMQDENDRVTYVNRRFSEIIEQPEKELLGSSIVNYIDREYVDVFNNQIKKMEGNSCSSCEIAWNGKSGKKIYTLLSPRTIFDENSNFKGSFFIITDITDRKKSEESLRLSEEMFSKAFKISPHGISIIELKTGVFCDANESFLNIIGFDRSEVIGKTTRDVDLFQSKEIARELVSSIFSKKQIRNYELEFKTRSNELKRGIISAEVIDIRGEPSVIVTLEDVTERKMLEKEIMSISERERQIIGQDLHDDLAPHLIGIEVLSTIIKQKVEKKILPDSSELEKIRYLIQEAITKTRGFVRGLCPVYLVDHGLEASLRELAGNTEEIYGISCEFNSAHSVKINDISVSSHLYHITQEAVHNAIFHGKAKKIRINLSNGRQTIMKISDDGTGFTRNTESKGMGIRIMGYRSQIINASFDLKSVPGRGTTVTVAFKRDVQLS